MNSAHHRQLVGLVAIGITAVVAYYALTPVHTYIFDAFGVACGAAFALRARHSAGGARVVWALGALGVWLWSAGDVLSGFLAYGDSGLGTYFTAADVVRLLAYPVLAFALLLAGRLRQPERDRGLLLEGVMLLAAATLLLFEFWVHPALGRSSASPLEVAATLAYPLMDLMLVAASLRLALSTATWTPAGSLLALGLVVTVVVDAVHHVQVLNGTYASPSPIDVGWMVAYLMWGAAALHPSAEKLTVPPDGEGEPILRRRAVLLGLLVGSPLLVILVSYARGASLELIPVLGSMALTAAALGLRFREIARTGSAHWRAHAFLYGSGVVVIFLALAVATARTADERRADGAFDLTEARVAMERLGTIETDARAGERSIAGARTAFDAEYRQILRRVPARSALFSRSAAERLRTDLSRYARLVREELVLFETGRRAAGVRLDDAQVDPLFAAIASDFQRAITRYQASARTRTRAERIGTVLAFLFGALIVTLLIRRFGAARRAAARADERTQAVLESEQQFQALISGAEDILAVVDRNGHLVRHSETVERVLGRPPGSLRGARLDDFLDPADAERTAALMARLASRAADSIDWCLRGADGSEITVEARIVNHLDDERLEGFIVNARDVTERRDLERELGHRAFHDHLTGLGNRALFEERIRHALERASRSLVIHAVIIIDLDDFKAVNDSLGHVAGDALLTEAARRLQLGVRPGDTLARLGGDEFAVLLEDVADVDAAIILARRLLDRLRQPYELAGHTVVVSGSAGVSVSDGSSYLEGDEEVLQELRNADLAMYEAKRVGGVVEVFAPELHEAVATRIELRSDIGRGLERGEFFVVYQPIVEFASRRAVGFEALMRWNHPGRGLVSPADFIPVAEQSGLILELGSFVLREAVRQMQAWNAQGVGKGLYVSVNMAGMQIQRDEIVDEVGAVLRESLIDPGQLLLELTESGLIHDSEGNERRISALRDLGVRLAIDDFGVGYSSLSYLQRFQFDVLKIDKSFIDPIALGGINPLVKAMITMGHDLQLTVIAEGIETPGQVYALQQRGCRLGQGYLFSRPVAPDELPASLFGAEPATHP